MCYQCLVFVFCVVVVQVEGQVYVVEFGDVLGVFQVVLLVVVLVVYEEYVGNFCLGVEEGVFDLVVVDFDVDVFVVCCYVFFVIVYLSRKLLCLLGLWQIIWLLFGRCLFLWILNDVVCIVGSFGLVWKVFSVVILVLFVLLICQDCLSMLKCF